MPARKLILRNNQAPGDILMLTAALRDLHRAHPGKYVTDVRTSSPDLWRHNPWVTPLREDDPEVERLPCHYPLIHRSHAEPVHFLQGFTEYLGERLGALEVVGGVAMDAPSCRRKKDRNNCCRPHKFVRIWPCV